MMVRRVRGLVLALLVLGLAPAAVAADARQTPAMRGEVLQKLRKAQRAYENHDAARTLRLLDALARDYSGARALNSYEQANVLNFRAFIHEDRQDYAQAITAYAQVLAQPGLPLAMESRTRLRLAQLYAQTRDFRAAAQMYERWFAIERAPDPEAWLQHAQALHESGDHARALAVLQDGLRAARERRYEPGENWYVLQRTLHFAAGDLRRTAAALDVLVRRWPRKEYLVQLSGIHGKLGDEAARVAVMDAAYVGGWLDTEQELLNLAYLFLDHATPYKAVRLLEHGMAAQRIATTPANVELLGIALHQARENARAGAMLARAAMDAGDAGMWLRLADIQLREHRPADAVVAAREALRLAAPDAQDAARLTLGVALYRDGQVEEARKAFADARGDTAPAAAQWLRYIDWEARHEGRPERG